MTRMLILVLGTSLTACSNSPHHINNSNGMQSTALSVGDSAEKTDKSGASAARPGAVGSGGSSDDSGSASVSGSSPSAAPAQTAASTSGKPSSSDNTKSSLTWLFGTFGVIGAVILASDAITGGQAIGLFGKKKSPEENKAPDVNPQAAPSSTSEVSPSSEGSETVVPANTESGAADCSNPTANPTPSSHIQSAQNIVKFAENPGPAP